MNIVLGISGSVSAYKAPWIVRDLRRAGHDVRVVMTASAAHFVAPLALEATSRHHVIMDPFDPEIQEGGSWHVHMAQWAHAMLIAPCSSSTLARLVVAQADSAVTLVACSLPKSTPLIIAPAMDADMWEHPATQRNIAQLKKDGAILIEPQSGELASGLTGTGRLPDVADILTVVSIHAPLGTDHTRSVNLRTSARAEQNTEQLPASGNTPGSRTVLVTAGPTVEPIDAVRSIVNHSTGTMGFALAEAAAERGYLVTLIAGPVHKATPRGVHRIDVRTAQDMFEAVRIHANADVILMAAAVADFTPSEPMEGKLKKTDANREGLTLHLERTPDILAWLGENKSESQVVVGFALETDHVLENAARKLHTKRADMIVANQAGVEHGGFGPGMNTITLVTRDTQAPYPPMSKRACAEVVLDAALSLLREKKES